MKGATYGPMTRGTIFGDRTTLAPGRRISSGVSLMRGDSHPRQHGLARTQVVLQAEIVRLKDRNRARRVRVFRMHGMI